MGSNKNYRIKNHVPLDLDMLFYSKPFSSLKNAKKCEKAGATSYKKVSVIFSEKNLPLIISRLDSSKNVTMVVGAMVEGLGSSAKQSKVQCNNLVPIIHKARKIVSTLFFSS